MIDDEGVQERLLLTARAAGWSAEYEVRGPRWIADVLCERATSFVALEAQRLDDGRLVERTEAYLRCGVRSAWFTPHLDQRKMRKLRERIFIFDAATVETVVPSLLNCWTEPLPYTTNARRLCECGAEISAIATFWCWRCWGRFAEPNATRLQRPIVHLNDWPRTASMPTLAGAVR